MYLLLILLVSPAFTDWIAFSNEAGNLPNNSKLVAKVSKRLQEDEKNILGMEAILKSLQSKIPQLEEEDVTFFRRYHTGKRYMREAIQELRELAHKIVTEVDNWIIPPLRSLSNVQPLKTTLDRMKILMIKTRERLEGARQKTYSGLIAFEDLFSIVSVVTQVTRFELDHGERFDIDNQIIDKLRERKENMGKYFDDLASSIDDDIKFDKSLFDIEIFLSEVEDIDDELTRRQIIDRYNIIAYTIPRYFKNIAEKLLAHQGYAVDLYRQYLAEKMNVAENLLEAERNILEVRALKHAVEEEYFPAYNEAKSILKETRQELMELAESTGTKVKDLKLVLEHLGEISNNSLLLKSFIDRMKDMRIDPVEMLKESRATYESAVKTFENTNSFIATKIRELERTSVSSKVSESGKKFEKTLKVLIDILHDEIEMISIWTKSAKAVSRNIDNNSEDHLRQFDSVKTIFINGLDDLENATNTFLDQQMEIIKLKE